ncbi:Serine-threonine/tyrosine-protein kinase, catalytic domain, partial [Dillenia turbinata]
MPSRPNLLPPPLIPTHTVTPPVAPPTDSTLPPISGGVAAAFSVFFLLAFCFPRLSKKSQTSSRPPYQFSYSTLRRATSSFSESRRLGQGGFGPVYAGTLSSGQEIAVKVMDSGSLQGEREFQNELFFAGKVDSDRIVSLLGFCNDRKRRRTILVYELMQNGSLQDALLRKKRPELMNWKTRVQIAIDIAKGLEYLHSCCNPPVIHSDIKPSNILLDRNFNASIADFGLARVKSEDQIEITVRESKSEEKKEEVVVVVEGNGVCATEDNNSALGDTESQTTAFDEFRVEPSPENFVRVPAVMTSPEPVTPEASPSEPILDRLDRVSVESGNNRKDWWKISDYGGGSEGNVKDYVMEWIGSEIKKERPRSDWIRENLESTSVGKLEKKRSKRRVDWWKLMDDENKVSVSKKEKRRQPREWWKEEYCDELAKKNKKKKKNKEGELANVVDGENWDDDDFYVERRRRRKSRSRSRSRGSIDWWLDGISGELFRGRRISHDSGGETPKSGVSSTPSMRGTVCYVAPEYGVGEFGQVSEKCDVYSFGVLLLVIISGRRPLHVSASPVSEYQKANLLSWARRLARAGKLLDLVDENVQGLDKEQAVSCITVALLCIQRSPAHRPRMKEVVAMLAGELETPHLPVEFSPSPPSLHPFKSRRKLRPGQMQKVKERPVSKISTEDISLELQFAIAGIYSSRIDQSGTYTEFCFCPAATRMNPRPTQTRKYMGTLKTDEWEDGYYTLEISVTVTVWYMVMVVKGSGPPDAHQGIDEQRITDSGQHSYEYSNADARTGGEVEGEIVGTHMFRSSCEEPHSSGAVQ